MSSIQRRIRAVYKWINVGDSAIVNPEGKFIAGPSDKKEDILFAEIDTRQMTGPRWKLDVAGNYARPDIFELTVNRRPSPMIRQKEWPPSPEKLL